VDVAAFFAYALGDRSQESGYIVMRFDKDFVHTGQVTFSLPNLGKCLSGDDAMLGPGFAYGDLHLQPFVEFVLFRPDLLHLWPGIAVNHAYSPVI
jgi:hypothetical protein